MVRDVVDTAGEAVAELHAVAVAVAEGDALTLAESVAGSVAVPHALLEWDVEADAEALPQAVATPVSLTDTEAIAGDAVTAAAVGDADGVTDLDAVASPGDADAGAADGDTSNELPAEAVHAAPVALSVGELETLSDATAEVEMSDDAEASGVGDVNIDTVGNTVAVAAAGDAVTAAAVGDADAVASPGDGDAGVEGDTSNELPAVAVATPVALSVGELTRLCDDSAEVEATADGSDDGVCESDGSSVAVGMVENEDVGVAAKV